jgi:hypothetical protein
LNKQTAAIVHAIGISLLLLNSASADESLLPGQSVTERERPELDASGMPLGAFRLYPSIELGVKSDSNLFANDNDPQEDIIGLYSPRLEFESGWSRHALRASVAAEFANYQQRPQEDYRDLSADLALQLEAGHASTLRFDALWASLHEERSSPDDVLGIEPTPFRHRQLQASWKRRSGRLLLDVRAGSEAHDYDDVPGLAGVINNDDRDRRRNHGALRLGVQMSQNLDLLLRGDVDSKDYELALDDHGLNRDSNGVRAGLGLQGALGGSSYIEAFAGYARRDYADPALGSISNPWFESRLVWSPSGLTSFELTAERRVAETTYSRAAAFDASRFGLAVDHELLRNLLIGASVFTQNDRYEGVDRRDRRQVGALYCNYLVNRHLQLTLQFERLSRRAEIDQQVTDDFAINSATLTLTMQR